MTNSLTTCAIENCTDGCCGICNSCKGINISEVPDNAIISAGTTLLGTDTFGYTMAQIAAYVLSNRPRDVITEIAAAQNQVSNVDVYVCTGTFDLELMTAENATRELKIISLTGTVTVNSDSVSAGGTDLINGVATTDVVAGDSMVITPYSAGWNGYKITQF